MAVIHAPHTYSEWVTVFTVLKNKTDDESVLAAMQAGSIAWQSGVAERFTSKLVEAINTRLNAATDKFQRDMSRAGGQERNIIQALLSLRKELQFLLNAINLPVIPEKDRDEYCKLVLEQADKIQKSLEDSAKKDRSGKLASIVRNNKINVITL